MIPLGDRLDRFSALVVLVNPLAVLRPQATVGDRKHRLRRMILIVSLDGVTDRFHAAVEADGDPAVHVGRAGTGQSESAGPADDPVVLVLRQLAETAPPLDSERIVAHETLDGTGEKTNPSAAPDEVPFSDQAMVPPPRDGLGRNIELAGQILDRQHLISGCLRAAGRVAVGGGSKPGVAVNAVVAFVKQVEKTGFGKR